MKLTVFSTHDYDREYFDKVNAEFGHEIVYHDAQLTEDTAALAEGSEAVCLFINDRANRAALESLANAGVKLLTLRSAGFNHVDLEAAEAFDLKVMRVPAYSPEAVAEHTAALILALNRKTHKAYNRVREGNFSLNKLTGFTMKEKTVGVVGTGKIGIAFCKIMLGFGCRVIAHDPYPSEEAKALGVDYIGLEELYNQADIISLHCPLTPENHRMIDGEAISHMKKGVMLINTSRGGLVHTKSVIQALKQRHIGSLGIDVYEQEENLFFRNLSEEVIEDDMIMRLMSFPNVLITAHQAFFTDTALTNIATTTLQNVTDFEQGNDSENTVTSDRIK
ncbi:MAG: hydroxyacid dehydrogenase [Ectothiorhodospiraceae bacterium]|nr:hydroxyacid dehydrogenase [Ectothiorhodospiraceae bacterium]